MPVHAGILHTRFMPAAKHFMPVLIVNVVLGFSAYPLIFVAAYGFSDPVGLREHGTFLVMAAILAVVAGGLGATVPSGALRELSVGRRAVFTVLASLALNSLAIGFGSIISATHKDEGSVSSDFSTTTDVLVATGLFLIAAMVAAIAFRVVMDTPDSRD